MSACVVLAVAVSAYTTYRDYRADKAAAALDAALIAKQDKRQVLEKVVLEYGSTSSGLWAQIELAFLEDKEGQRPKAIARMAEINAGLSPRSPLKPLVLTNLAIFMRMSSSSTRPLPSTPNWLPVKGLRPRPTGPWAG